MTKHPIYLMLGVWGGSLLVFLLLPFQLLGKPMTAYGLFVLGSFLLAFVLGGMFVPRRMQVEATLPMPVASDYLWAERILTLAVAVAVIAFGIDIAGHNVLDLAASQAERSDRAMTLLRAEASASTGWFQLAFLTYPAAYVYMALHTIYAPSLSYWRLSIFSFLPVLLSLLSMGGRSPLLYAFAIFSLSLYTRHGGWCWFKSLTFKTLLLILGALSVLAVAVYYFSVIFLVRSETVGGAEAMFTVAEQIWGVGFQGPLSGYLFSMFGKSLTYLIFIFTWYFIQGMAIATYIFTGYDGPLQLGVYGVDLVTALMRRMVPESVAQGFDALLSLGTYGFFPSAFGSLYVDFGLFGLLFTVLWGYGAMLCYRKIYIEKKTTWLLFAPFVSAGIFFSLINTPLGFANGFVTHLWLLLTFCLFRARKAVAANMPAPAAMGHQ